MEVFILQVKASPASSGVSSGRRSACQCLYPDGNERGWFQIQPNILTFVRCLTFLYAERVDGSVARVDDSVFGTGGHDGVVDGETGIFWNMQLPAKLTDK